MTRSEAYKQTLAIVQSDSKSFGENVVSHPNRPSMGQYLASKGQLVFEGELLEFPLKWHPSRTTH